MRMLVLGAAIARQLGAGDKVQDPPHIEPAKTRPAGRASTTTSTRMTKQMRAGTKPELALRRDLHSRGFRYRADEKPEVDIRRTADMVFRRAKVAVFLDGCFWHGCAIHSRDTKSNTLWWREKIEANKTRDAETTELLEGRGWTVVRVWEHEPTSEAADRVETALRSKSDRP